MTLVLRVIDGTPGATEGQAVPSARIEVDEGAFATVTDAQGFARLQGLLSGRHVLGVRSEPFARFEQVVDLGSAPGSQQVTEHSLVVRLGAVATRLSGLVFGPDGAHLAGALICLDTRTRANSGNGAHTRSDARAVSALESPPHAVTDQGGAFELDLLAGFPESSLLVCPLRPDLPLVVRRPLRDEEKSGLVLIEVNVPAACSVQVRCLQADGSPGRGSLELSDGIVTYDLTADALLRQVPGSGRWNDLTRPAGGLDVRLAPGGYKALFRPEDEGGSMKAFFLTVTDVGPQRMVLQLEGG